MNGAFVKLILLLLIVAPCARAPSAVGGPIDFLRRVGDSIAHSHHPHPVRRTVRKGGEKSDRQKDRDVAAPDLEPTPAERNIPPPTPSPNPPSPSPTARVASSVPPTQRSRADLPYGVPVPNKPGFVTSPYSPNGGYVDIRGYPSGIEVKDPYTGKIFLTP